MRVLLIDDEPHIRHMMHLTLEAVGYEVDEAADGEAGVAQFASGGPYDAVVLDQKMPGIDGLETLSRIKARAPDARILMATAFASIELAVDAMRLGATNFLRKPMTPDTLRGAVAAAIAGGGPARLTRRDAPARSSDVPEISTLTLNGFRIFRSRDSDPAVPPSDHVFRVKQFPAGEEFTVTVTIDPEAVARVARLTHRRLEPGSSFWRLQSERRLAAHLWSEGRGPDGGRLTVQDVSREDLDAAAVWEES